MSDSTSSWNQKIIWLGRGLSILASLPFIMSAFMKLTASPEFLAQSEKMGLPASIITGLGILEVICVIIYLIPWTATLGAILLTGYLGGAICTHLRLGESFLVPAVLGVLVWLGLYLRDGRLKSLLPLRKL